jgi:DNA-binding MarR family transcriptional regulator
MTEKRLSLSLDMVRTMAGLSHILSWGEFRVYTTLLYERDPLTLKVRMNQAQIATDVGYDTSVIKDFIARLKEMGLIRKWRSQRGNYYELVLPLPETVVEKVRHYIPAFGREMELFRNRKRKKSLADNSSKDAVIFPEIQQGISTEDVLANNEEAHIPHETCNAVERGFSEEIAPEAVADVSTSEEPALDLQIAHLLDTLEHGTVRNGTCRFLESVGFLGPQLALDQPIVVDRRGLLGYLLDHDANTVMRFCELAEDFKNASLRRIPYIDVPLDFPITLRIHHKLDLFPCGNKWLRQAIGVRNDDGILLPDWEVRQNLYDFMLEHGLKTFDDVIVLAKVRHHEIVGARKTKTVIAVSPEDFGLGTYIQ